MGGIDLNLASNRCFGVPVVFLFISIVTPYEQLFYVLGMSLSDARGKKYLALKEKPKVVDPRC